MTTRARAMLLASAWAGVAFAQDVAIDAAALPLAIKRVAASADECSVWRREQSFARSVERHDAGAFASHLHAGTVFNVGTDEYITVREIADLVVDLLGLDDVR